MSTVTRYVDGLPVSDEPRAAHKPNAIACDGCCGRNLRVTVFDDHGVIVDASVARQLTAEQVAALVEFLEGL